MELENEESDGDSDNLGRILSFDEWEFFLFFFSVFEYKF